MIFSSLTFVVFFAIVLWLFFTLKEDQTKKRMLLVASYIFYGWWDWRFCFLMLASSTWSWYWGNRIADSEDARRRKLFLLFGLCGDLGILAYFKYTNFFIESFAAAFGLEKVRALDIILPVGISFFTFQSMSYTIDVYRRHLAPYRNYEKFLLFVSFFPQLVAGPIVRASQFLPQLDRPAASTLAHVSLGLQMFLLGLFQKLVIADNLSVFVDPVFAAPGSYDTATLWAAMFAYGFQIFCDFSGYSIMAIGIAQVLGYKLPENFRTPYLSCSITEFWRRWHISLSTWLRDYLYISLGGNRKGRRHTDLVLLLTMLLGGLWHGAAWNFVIWGGAHGVGLVIHKHWSRLTPVAPAPIRAAVGWALTLLFVFVLWVPFRCRDLTTTSTYLKGLFVDSGGMQWLHTQSMFIIGVMVVWHLLQLLPNKLITVLPTEHPFAYGPLWAIGLLVLGVLLFAPYEVTPFIYFQF